MPIIVISTIMVILIILIIMVITVNRTCVLCDCGRVYLPHMLVVSVIDVLAGGLVVDGVALNARLAWVALFAVGTLLAAVGRGTVAVRNGVAGEL